MNIFWDEVRKENQIHEKYQKEELKIVLNENVVQLKDTNEAQRPQVKPRTKLQNLKISQHPQPLPVITSVGIKQRSLSHGISEKESNSFLSNDIKEMTPDCSSKENHKILEIKAPKDIDDNSSLSETQSFSKKINESKTR